MDWCLYFVFGGLWISVAILCLGVYGLVSLFCVWGYMDWCRYFVFGGIWIGVFILCLGVYGLVSLFCV